MTFKALVVEKNSESKISPAIQTLTEDQLPDCNVTVAIEYTTVNDKDGLCMTPNSGLVHTFPHVPGIDFAGTVETSTDDRYRRGEVARLLQQKEEYSFRFRALSFDLPLRINHNTALLWQGNFKRRR